MILLGINVFEQCPKVQTNKPKKCFDKDLNLNLILGEKCEINNYKIAKDNSNSEFISLFETKYILVEKGKSLIV